MVRRASAGQIYHGVGRLFDSWQECGKRRETVVWFTRFGIARMKVNDRSASFGRADRGLGNLVGRHWEVGQH